jgi:hypothetical protein
LSTSHRAHQHTTPLLIDSLEASGTARALDRLPFSKREASSSAHDEAWLQTLIYRFPQVLPVAEIEQGFGRLVPVCMELPTPAGYVDNLYVTDTGNLALAECKLWRNPEARREVITQIIDYAHAMARWSYEDLEVAIRLGKKLDGDQDRSLFSLFGDEGELDEQAFVDAVSRNLRLGRVLLLIVGDGIREGVETLSSYLQMHAGFHFALGIVEMPIFALPSQGFLVQPRVLARTVNIERGIVRFSEGQIKVEPPEAASINSGAGQRTSISRDQLLEKLGVTVPGAPDALKRFLEQADALGVFAEPATKSLQIRWTGPDDANYALAGITPEGELKTYQIGWKPRHIGRLDLAHEYLAKVAALVGGTVRQTQDPAQWYIVDGGKPVEALKLLSRSTEWLDIIRWYTGELNDAIEKSLG